MVKLETENLLTIISGELLLATGLRSSYDLYIDGELYKESLKIFKESPDTTLEKSTLILTDGQGDFKALPYNTYDSTWYLNSL